MVEVSLNVLRVLEVSLVELTVLELKVVEKLSEVVCGVVEL